MNAFFRGRKWIVALWAAFALLTLAWAGYWQALRVGVKRELDAWIAQQNKEGAEVSYDRARASGFPLRMTLSLENFSYVSASNYRAMAAPLLKLHVNPSDLSLILIEPQGKILWRRSWVETFYTPRTALLSVRLKGRKPERVSFKADNIAIERGDGAKAAIKGVLLHLRPDPRAAADMQLALDITGWTLSAPVSGLEGLGQDIGALEARVVIERADAISGAEADRLSAWRAAGGAARVEGVRLRWGVADLTGRGRLTADEYDHIAGRLDVTLTDPPAALTALADSAAVPPAMADALRKSAEAAARKGEAVTMPLLFDDGVLSLGALPLRTLDRIP